MEILNKINILTRLLNVQSDEYIKNYFEKMELNEIKDYYKEIDDKRIIDIAKAARRWKIKEILYDIDFVEEVKKEFEQYNIHESAILSGQALASVIYKKLNLGIGTPINDIDLFFCNMDSSVSDCYDLERVEKDSKYFEDKKLGINEVYYTGKLNIIDIKTNLDDWCFVDNLLESFDFNAVQVALKYNGFLLRYTEEFIDFLEEPILKPQYVHNYDKMLKRAAKKQREIGVPFEDFVLYSEEEIELAEILEADTKEFYDNLIIEIFECQEELIYKAIEEYESKLV